MHAEEFVNVDLTFEKTPDGDGFAVADGFWHQLAGHQLGILSADRPVKMTKPQQMRGEEWILTIAFAFHTLSVSVEAHGSAKGYSSRQNNPGLDEFQCLLISADSCCTNQACISNYSQVYLCRRNAQ